MPQLGCLARFFNRYKDEFKFAKENNFDFMQLWYDNRGLCLHEDDKDFINTINKYNFPTIIHAVLNINEFEEHIPKLLDILNKLNHKALNILKPHGINLFLENNSKLDPIFTTTDEIQKIFSQNADLEFLLDIAHIDNINHLQDLINIKYPKILHIADRHFDVIHEHLPIGHGEIDFQHIFSKLLPQYNGKIILEIVNKDSDIINSKNLIQNFLNTPNK